MDDPRYAHYGYDGFGYGPGGAEEAPSRDGAAAPDATGADETANLRSGPPTLEDQVVEALKSIYDPEIPVNIYELGLIYSVDVAAGGDTKITMTLTSPACPVAGSLPGEVESRVMDVEGVTSCDVEIVWDPQWNPSMMSEAARLELGLL